MNENLFLQEKDQFKPPEFTLILPIGIGQEILSFEEEKYSGFTN